MLSIKGSLQLVGIAALPVRRLLSSLRERARRLLAVEASSKGASNAHVHETVRVCEKLRISLTRFAGSDGFTALLRRALVLARADFPSVEIVKFKHDGPLEGLEVLAADATNCGPEATVAITAHLLGLLVTFIGAPTRW